MALTDKELLDVYSNAAMAVWPADGNGTAGLRAVYDRACEDCAKVCETYDYGAGSPAEEVRSLKHEKGGR